MWVRNGVVSGSVSQGGAGVIGDEGRWELGGAGGEV